MQRIMLIGKNGQLGWELQRTLATLGEVKSYDYPEIDLSKPENLRNIIRNAAPQIIVNAAAYTNVDKAESETELAQRVNAIAPGVMAEEARRLNAAIIHYSTDYVFDGKKGSSYVETDAPDPLNTYGKTKLEGELAVKAAGEAYLIFRTSWVFSLRQGGFVTKVLQWARQQTTLRIVDDQIGSPTWSRMLAEATAQVIAQGRNDPVEYLREKAGLYHLAGAGTASRYEWARAILELDPHREEQVMKELLPAKTSEFPTPAVRPSQTGLRVHQFENAFGQHVPGWEECLKLIMK
ncbi:MAG: dTDP-4-dehydrorhamnose reductase [Anaerolineaceae bacterium]